MFSQNFNCKNQAGVTLVETIVSLGILTMGIISALALITSSIVYSQTTEQKIVVVNLARESLEILRSIRAYYDITEQEKGFNLLAAGNYITQINYATGDLELIAVDSQGGLKYCHNCILKLYDGRYLHNAPLAESGNTIFKRMVSITDVSANEKKVVSQVYWMERGREHTFILEENLTNW